MKKVSRLQVPGVVGKYKNGKYNELPHLVRHIRTTDLKIICDQPTGIQLDGEVLEAKEIEFSVSPHKIRFFYPKELTWETEKATV